MWREKTQVSTKYFIWRDELKVLNPGDTLPTVGFYDAVTVTGNAGEKIDPTGAALVELNNSQEPGKSLQRDIETAATQAGIPVEDKIGVVYEAIPARIA